MAATEPVMIGLGDIFLELQQDKERARDKGPASPLAICRLCAKKDKQGHFYTLHTFHTFVCERNT